MPEWRIGAIGFAYPEWQGGFYPQGLRPQDRLSYYADRFDLVELDTSFYAIPTAERLRVWHGSTPNSFLFVLKAPRTVTHEPAANLDDLALFHQRVEALGPKLAAVLFQFPPDFAAERFSDLERLLTRARGLPIAVEFRHPTWWRPLTLELLREHRAAWVAADLAPVGDAALVPKEGMAYRPYGVRDTAQDLFLRLNGRHGQYESDAREECDATPRLEWWLGKLGPHLTPERRVLVSIGNSFAGHAPATARRLRGLVGLAEPGVLF